jgi:hypothetical protein
MCTPLADEQWKVETFVTGVPHALERSGKGGEAEGRAMVERAACSLNLLPFR